MCGAPECDAALLSVEGPVLADIVEEVLAGWLGGMFVREICPGMYRESSEPILM